MEEHWIFVNNTNIGYFYIKVFTILWRLAYNRGRRKERYVEGGGGGGGRGCVWLYRYMHRIERRRVRSRFRDDGWS